MALQATLQIEKNSYDVLDMDYELSKPYDNNYKPSAFPMGGIINFSILSPLDKSTIFQEWVLSPAYITEGTFFLPVTMGIEHTAKTLKFQNAHCIRLHESYSSFSGSQMQMRITISAAILIFNDALKFDNIQRTVEKI